MKSPIYTDRAFWVASYMAMLAGVVGTYYLLTLNEPTKSTARGFAISYGVLTFLQAAVYIRRSLRGVGMAMIVFCIAQVYWFGLPAIVIAADSGNWFAEEWRVRVDAGTVLDTTALLMVFGIVMGLVYHGVKLLVHKQSISDIRLEHALDERTIWRFAILLLAFGLLPFLLMGGGLGEIVGGIAGSRSVSKGWAQTAFTSNPLYVVGRSAMVTSSLLFLHITISRTRLRRASAFLFLFGFIVTFLDSGTRTWTLMIIVPPFLLLYRNAMIRGKYVKWLLGGTVILVVLALAVSAQRSFRSQGMAETDFATIGEEKGDNDFFTETAIAVSLVPKRFERVDESVLLLFLANPIPRAIWSSKPYPKTIQVYGIGKKGFDEYKKLGASSMPSIVGQYWMIWGLGGVVFIGAFLGVLVTWADRILEGGNYSENQKVWAAIIAAWVFADFRGMYPGFHYPWVLMGLLVLYEIVRSRRIRRAHYLEQMRRATRKKQILGA